MVGTCTLLSIDFGSLILRNVRKIVINNDEYKVLTVMNTE